MRSAWRRSVKNAPPRLGGRKHEGTRSDDPMIDPNMYSCSSIEPCGHLVLPDAEVCVSDVEEAGCSGGSAPAKVAACFTADAHARDVGRARCGWGVSA